VAGENLLSNPVGRLSKSIGRLFAIEDGQPFEGLTGNEKSFFEMSDKLPQPIAMPDGTLYQPKAKDDPVPPGVLKAQVQARCILCDDQVLREAKFFEFQRRSRNPRENKRVPLIRGSQLALSHLPAGLVFDL
jgi:hypothetical protein